MDVFNAPTIGSPRALASRSGNTAGTSTDIIYPVSRLTHGSFSSGKTLEFNFRSDKHRHVLLRSTRLVVHMEHKFGEVSTTAHDAIHGPQDTATGVRPSKSIMYATLPGTTLFGTGQARYVLNSVVVTNQNHLLDSSLVQLLLTTNNDGPSTSGSNMMTSTRKDTGLAASSFWSGSEYNADAENYSLLPITVAPYLLGGKDGTARVDITVAGAKAAKTATNAKLQSLKDKDVAGQFAFEMTLISQSGTSFVVANDDGDKLVPGMIITVAVAGSGNAGVSHSGDGNVTVGTVTRIASGDDAGAYTVTLAAGGAFTGTVETAATADEPGDVLTVLKFEESDAGDKDLGTVTFERIAQAFAVKMKASASKMTSPNPRVEILQQGFNPSTGIVTTQTSEPLLLV